LYYRVNNIDREWARTIHPDNLFQQARNSLALQGSAFSGHLDTQNDPREMMCAVPVLHRITETKYGLARYAMIGYSRKSCYDAGIRTMILAPVVREVARWYYDLPSTRSKASNDLFGMPRFENDSSIVVFPVHCDKSVGLSPFIDGIIKMQATFALTKEQSVALCYHVVTNESPFYFWETVREYIVGANNMEALVSSMSPVELGLDFHNRIWHHIKSPRINNPPKRHQPHNGIKPDDEKIRSSIISLIKLTDALASLPSNECCKQFFHSKSIALLIRSTQKGGCHAAGPLTSQGLLHVLSCLGLIPIGLASWGEIAVDQPYLVERDILMNNGRADMYLSCLALSLSSTLSVAEQVNCKYSRYVEKKDNIRRDAIYKNQLVYSIDDSGLLVAFDGKQSHTIGLPAHHWADSRKERPVDSKFWLVPTKTKVKGANRVRNSKKKQKMEDPNEEILEELLPSWEQIVQCPDDIILAFPLNQYLGASVDEGPIPWKRILGKIRAQVVDNKRRITHQFGFYKKNGEYIEPPSTGNLFECVSDCINDGILRYLAENNRPLLAKKVFQMVESEAASEQSESRDWEGCQSNKRSGKTSDIRCRYYILYRSWHENKFKQPQKIAIVRFLARDAVVLAILNDKYLTEEKDWYLLHRDY
jgi:hypothetical protein